MGDQHAGRHVGEVLMLRATFLGRRTCVAAMIGVALAAAGAATWHGSGAEAFTGETLIRVTGLPSGMVAEVYFVEPAQGGGFHRRSQVATSPDTTVRVPLGHWIEAAPIFLGPSESLQAVRRFQPAAHIVDFAFRRHVLVTVSTWSRGGLPADPTGGSVSQPSQWVPVGQQFTVVSVPRAGWRLAHWGVFGAAERVSSSRISRLDRSLTIRVDRPLHLVAGFVPE